MKKFRLWYKWDYGYQSDRWYRFSTIFGKIGIDCRCAEWKWLNKDLSWRIEEIE